jgi:AGZA family xanthine/uracil permease-like MFS transporter
VLAASAVFVIERQLRAAAVFLLVGGVFTWFGLMHSPELGLAQSPTIAAAYVLVAAIVLLCERYATVDAADAEIDDETGETASTAATEFS